MTANRDTSRISLNIHNTTLAQLREIAERDGSNMTATIRRAVNLYDALTKEEGKRIQVVDEETGETAIITII